MNCNVFWFQNHDKFSFFMFQDNNFFSVFISIHKSWKGSNNIRTALLTATNFRPTIFVILDCNWSIIEILCSYWLKSNESKLWLNPEWGSQQQDVLVKSLFWAPIGQFKHFLHSHWLDRLRLAACKTAAEGKRSSCAALQPCSSTLPPPLPFSSLPPSPRNIPTSSRGPILDQS